MVPFQAAVKTKPGIRISQGVVVSTLGTWAQSAGACRGVRDHVPLGDITGTCICIGTLFILRHLMRMTLCILDGSSTSGPSAGPRVGMVCFWRKASIYCPRVQGAGEDVTLG